MERVYTWVGVGGRGGAGGGTGNWYDPANWLYAEYNGPGLYDPQINYSALVNGRVAAQAPGAGDTVSFGFLGGLVFGGGTAARFVAERDAGQIVLADNTSDGRSDVYSFGALELRDRMLVVNGAVLASRDTDLDWTARLFVSSAGTAVDQWGRTYSADLGALTLEAQLTPSGLWSGAVIAGKSTVEADSVAGNAAVRSDAYDPSGRVPVGGLYSETGTGYLLDPVPTVILQSLSSGGAGSEGTPNVKGGGEVAFLAVLDLPSTSALTLGWHVGLRGGNTATPDDFLGGVLPSGLLAFAPGETSKMISVRTAQDAVIEPDETFVVELIGPSAGLRLGGPALLFGTILNDDRPPLPTVSLAFDHPGQFEGKPGETTAYSFTAKLSAAAATQQSVQWAVSGGSTNPTDAVDFAGATSGSLVFAAGETQKSVTVRVAGDATVEPDETFIVSLSAETSGIDVPPRTFALATVLTDDPAAPPPPPIHVSDAQIAAYEAMAARMFQSMVAAHGDHFWLH